MNLNEDKQILQLAVHQLLTISFVLVQHLHRTFIKISVWLKLEDFDFNKLHLIFRGVFFLAISHSISSILDPNVHLEKITVSSGLFQNDWWFPFMWLEQRHFVLIKMATASIVLWLKESCIIYQVCPWQSCWKRTSLPKFLNKQWFYETTLKSR